MSAYSFKETLIQQVYKAKLENARSLLEDTTECTIIVFVQSFKLDFHLLLNVYNNNIAWMKTIKCWKHINYLDSGNTL